MIPTAHIWWAEAVFRPYVYRLLRRHFDRIVLLGEEPSIAPERPLVLLPNHSTWWDGFFVYVLNREILRRPIYLMMLEEQLARYRFFARVGAYSIAPESPKAVVESLRYTCSLLEEPIQPRPLVCVFPQGELRPWDVRPLGYRRGIAWIARHVREPLTILPLAIRVEFLKSQRPEAFLLFGRPSVGENLSDESIGRMEQEHGQLLEELRDQMLASVPGKVLLQGRRSVNEAFDTFRARFLRHRSCL